APANRLGQALDNKEDFDLPAPKALLATLRILRPHLTRGRSVHACRTPGLLSPAARLVRGTVLRCGASNRSDQAPVVYCRLTDRSRERKPAGEGTDPRLHSICWVSRCCGGSGGEWTTRRECAACASCCPKGSGARSGKGETR